MAIAEALSRLWSQWLAAFTVFLLSISLGMVVGWTSPYLAKLAKIDSPLPITQEEASWIASLMPLGRLFGAIAGSMAVEYFGSKTSLLLTGLPLIIGWICIIFANSATWLYIARIFSGSSMGMVFSCFPLYIGEISAPSIRGALVGLVINGMPVGTLIGNIMGPNMSMMWFGVVSLITNLLFMAIFPFLPQSPHYLIRRNLRTEAEKAISWYHRNSDVEAELEAVEHFVKSSEAMPLRERLRQMNEKKNRRAFMMITMLFIFMQLSGVNSIVFYMEIIVAEAKVTCIEPSTVVVIVNSLGIVIGWLAIYAVDRCGRRVLLAISSSGVITGMALLGLHFALLDEGYESESLQWLPIFSLIVFMLMCIGLVPVPSTMLSEIFPANLKSVAGFVGSVTSAIFAFTASKTYQTMVNLMTEQYVFWIYGFTMVVCLVYSIVWIPETKGKTLQEIQDMLARESRSEQRNEENEETENTA